MAKEAVEKLEKQMKALEERLKRVKARESAKERNATNKRRYLLGAMVETWMEEDPELKDTAKRRLDTFLVRDSDRRYFGMAPAKKADSEDTAA